MRFRRELSRKGVNLFLRLHDYERLFDDGYGYNRYAEALRLAWSLLPRQPAEDHLVNDPSRRSFSTREAVIVNPGNRS